MFFKKKEIKTTRLDVVEKLLNDMVRDHLSSFLHWNNVELLRSELRNILDEKLKNNEEYKKIMTDKIQQAIESVKNSEEYKKEIEAAVFDVIRDSRSNFNYQGIYNEAITDSFKKHIEASVSKTLAIS